MTSLNDFAAECLRLYRSTPDRVPSVAWVQLLIRHASDLLTAIESYSAHLAGRPYRLGILSDPNGTDGCATFAPTMAALNGATARLECQLNPEHRSRGDGGLTATLGVPDGWGDRQQSLLESMGWLRTYVCQVQDAMGWAEQAEGWTVLQGQGTTPGTREVYGDARFINYSVDPETFVWPVIPAGVATGVEQIVNALDKILSCHSDTPSQTQVEYSPAALVAELGISPGTLNNYAKAAGVETPERGGKNHTYSVEDAVRICDQFATRSGEKKTREKAKSLRDKLTKTER
jgi:hypothetical protein